MGHIGGQDLDLEELQRQSASQPDPPLDPRTSEDCLFLDVVVPKKIFDKRGVGKGAPVLVWIYGGGYLVGEKTGAGLHNPAGILQASESLGDEGFVFVAMNYRVSSFSHYFDYNSMLPIRPPRLPSSGYKALISVVARRPGLSVRTDDGS